MEEGRVSSVLAFLYVLACDERVVKMMYQSTYSLTCRTFSLALGLVLVVSFSFATYAAGSTPLTVKDDSLEALLTRLNSECGTDFHVITPEGQ